MSRARALVAAVATGRTHDPALVVGQDGDPWYVFSTGDRAVGDGAVQIRTSPDGREWIGAGVVWDEAPAWVADVVPEVESFWAPEVYQHDGTYYLYYSASTFGSNRSAIGLLTAIALDPDAPDAGWTDRGEVIRSEPGRDDWNAIAPGIVEDADGVPWMAFGSFGGGLQIVRLEWPSGLRADPDAEPVTIASRGVHFYDADAAGDVRLAIHRLGRDDDGWPVAAVEAAADRTG